MKPSSETGTASSFSFVHPNHEAVDTTLLLEELRRTYKKNSVPVPVNFRQIAGWVRAGDQLTHQIHPYPAKLLPHIAHFFARASALRQKGTSILDPFSGSDTVALEASLAGATPLVADSNPFATLLTRVKTTPYEVDDLLVTAQHIRRRIQRLRTAPVVPVVNEKLWYRPKTKKCLELILRAVMDVDHEELRDFFRVCFSVTARRLSHADPSVSVPVVLKKKATLSSAANSAIEAHLKWVRTASPVDEFERVIQANVARVAAANKALSRRSRCVIAGPDARRLTTARGGQLAPDSVALTITSPPYGSAQKYIRASSLSLNWLSMCAPSELANVEGRSIGREHLSARREHEQLRTESAHETSLEPVLRAIRSRSVQRAAITDIYLREMRLALGEIARVTARGGHTVVVIGNNTVAGFVVRNDVYVTEVMQEHGLTLDLALTDRIHSRGLMTARHRSAALIAGESVLLFRK